MQALFGALFKKLPLDVQMPRDQWVMIVWAPAPKFRIVFVLRTGSVRKHTRKIFPREKLPTIRRSSTARVFEHGVLYEDVIVLLKRRCLRSVGKHDNNTSKSSQESKA